MEPEANQNPIDVLDREQERAVAAAVHARFVTGDVGAAMRRIDDLARRRLAFNAQVSRLSA